MQTETLCGVDYSIAAINSACSPRWFRAIVGELEAQKNLNWATI